MGLHQEFFEKPSIEQLIDEWLKDPLASFHGYFDNPLDWSTCYGVAPMEGLPDTHGYSCMPDIRCEYKELLIGNVEGISMYSGGTVRIKHFALNPDLTRKYIGEKFFSSILEFIKSKNAVSVEFHENHSSKIEHYRRFFEKQGIAEIKDGIWKVNLYMESDIPKHVLDFHEGLKR